MKFAIAICLVATSLATVAESKTDKTIKLEERTNSKYQKSGYSFRYKTQNEKEHRNYVDIVYEAGLMRINNHGGQRNQIVDLGAREGLSKAEKFDLEDATWTTDMLAPEEGHAYALHVTASQQQMIVVFYVSKVTHDKLEFSWQQVDGPKKWPVSLQGRGTAGTSGMLGRGTPRRSKAR